MSDTLSPALSIISLTAQTLSHSAKKVETLRDKAYILAQFKILSDAFESLSESWKDQIQKCPGFYEMFPDIDKKVVLQEGKAPTEINNEVLNELTLADIKKIVKVTETGLGTIEKEYLIPKYKVNIGTGKPSVAVRALSKDDLKKLNG